MKILHIAPEWKWSNIFIMPIVVRQIDEGNNVWLSTPNPDIVESKSIENLNIVNWNKKYKNFFKYIVSVFFVIQMVRHLNIQRVYAHTTVDSSLYILGLRLFTSANIVYVNHGVPYLGYKGIMKWILIVTEFIDVNFSHRVITITKSMVLLLSSLNWSAKKIDVFSPGTLVGVEIPYKCYSEVVEAREKAQLNMVDKKFRIIYVGRIEARKGIVDLINAMNLTTVDCELIILGGFSNDLNVKFNSSKIKFLGFQTDLSPYYLIADLLCVPSHHEGFGQVYLEAASYGVVPVCCNIPGPTDFISHGLNGFVVEPKSSKSILNLLFEIECGQYDIEKIRENAFNSVCKYEASLVISNNMELLK